MALLTAVLRIASLFTWVATVIAVLQALRGAPWAAAVIWGGLAVVLALACAAARHAEAAAEQRAVQHELAGTPGPLAVPADPGGAALFATGWILAIGGMAVAVGGLLLTSDNTWWALLAGGALVALAIPVFGWESRRWAAHVLPRYEADVLASGAPAPSSELRLALWTAAHSSPRPGASVREQREDLVAAYRALVGAWSGAAARAVTGDRVA